MTVEEVIFKDPVLKFGVFFVVFFCPCLRIFMMVHRSLQLLVLESQIMIYDVLIICFFHLIFSLIVCVCVSVYEKLRKIKRIYDGYSYFDLIFELVSTSSAVSMEVFVFRQFRLWL